MSAVTRTDSRGAQQRMSYIPLPDATDRDLASVTRKLVGAFQTLLQREIELERRVLDLEARVNDLS